MQRNHEEVSISGPVVVTLVLCNAIVMEQALVNHTAWYWILIVTIPILLYSIRAFNQKVQDKT